MDSIQKMLHGIGAVLAKIFTGKEIKTNFEFILQDLEPENIYAIAEYLVEAKKFNDAEDFLFKAWEKEGTEELYDVGLMVIDKMIKMGKQELEENGYTLKEAKQLRLDWIEMGKVLFS